MIRNLKTFLRRIAGVIWYGRKNRISCTALVLSWNRADLTIRCLESLLKNGPSDLHIILVDNNSSGEEKKKLKNYILQYPSRICAIWLKRNFGGAAFNRVSWRAEGEFILFCENDLSFAPGWFEKMKALFDLDNSLGQLSPLASVPQIEKGEVWTAKPSRLVTCGQYRYLQSFSNLGTTSLIPRRVLKKGVFWRNITSSNSSVKFPDDGNLSAQIRNLGFKIGWMEKPLADNVGHQAEQWEKNPDYYIDNWKLKSELGIDGRKENADDLDFQSQKRKHETLSQRSRQILLQRTSPHLVAKENWIPEIGRIYLDSGAGFRMGQFLEFEYIYGEPCEVKIQLSPSVKFLRLDPIDAPAKVSILKFKALAQDGSEVAISFQSQGQHKNGFEISTENQNPEIHIEAERPIHEIRFTIQVQAGS